MKTLLKVIKITLITTGIFTLLLIIYLFCFVGFMKPAPRGIHGNYSLDSSQVYTLNEITKDSILKVFSKEKLLVKSGRLNNYDVPWDSLRYYVGNINCDNEIIEAFIDFEDKKAINTTMKILWYNAEPTEDDDEYQKRAERYCNCFDAFLKRKKLVK